MTDVRAYPGTKSQVRILEHEGTVYFSSPERLSDEEMVLLPMAVKRVWRQMFVGSVEKMELSSPEFYEVHGDEYAVWSFERHQAQAQMIINQCSSDTAFIVPADGLGVFSNLLKGRVVAGDLVPSDWAAEVVQESIVDTVQRGIEKFRKQEWRSSLVIILSYCQQFITESELRYILGLGVPVVSIEANSGIMRRANMRWHGPGVYSYNWEGEMILRLSDFEKSNESQIMYSENLLREGYILMSPSLAADYVLRMRPTVPLRYHDRYRGVRKYISKGSPTTVLAVTVAEALVALKRREDVYFYPTGRLFTGVIPLRDNRDTMMLSARSVYKIVYSKELDDAIKYSDGFFKEISEDGQFLYFSLIVKKQSLITQSEIGQGRVELTKIPLYLVDSVGRMKFNFFFSWIGFVATDADIAITIAETVPNWFEVKRKNGNLLLSIGLIPGFQNTVVNYLEDKGEPLADRQYVYVFFRLLDHDGTIWLRNYPKPMR